MALDRLKRRNAVTSKQQSSCLHSHASLILVWPQRYRGSDVAIGVRMVAGEARLSYRAMPVLLRHQPRRFVITNYGLDFTLRALFGGLVGLPCERYLPFPEPTHGRGVPAM